MADYHYRDQAIADYEAEDADGISPEDRLVFLARAQYNATMACYEVLREVLDRLETVASASGAIDARLSKRTD